jgi:hypothetical protein
MFRKETEPIETTISKYSDRVFDIYVSYVALEVLLRMSEVDNN